MSWNPPPRRSAFGDQPPPGGPFDQGTPSQPPWGNQPSSAPFDQPTQGPSDPFGGGMGGPPPGQLPPGYGAPPPGNSRIKAMVIALIAIGAAVVLIAVTTVVVLNLQRGTPADPPPVAASSTSTDPTSPPTSDPTPSVTPTDPSTSTDPTAGTAGPSPSWSAPSGAPKSVVDNPIYSAQMGPWECPGLDPAVPNGGEEFETWLEDDIIGCMMDRYRPAVAEAGAELTEPQVIYFDKPTETPCGVSRQPDQPPFYCSGNEAIYVNADTIRTYRETARLAALSLLFHEFAHHVQHRAGILNQAYEPPFNGEDRLQISRRMELQAECFSWIQVQTLTTTQWSDSDDQEFRRWLEGPKDTEHGSNASYRFWYERASGEASFTACNTFIAPKDTVA